MLQRFYVTRRARPAGQATRSGRGVALTFFFGSPGQRWGIARRPHASGGTVNTQQARRCVVFFWFARPVLGDCARATRVRRDGKHAAGFWLPMTDRFVTRQGAPFFQRGLRSPVGKHATTRSPPCARESGVPPPAFNVVAALPHPTPVHPSLAPAPPPAFNVEAQESGHDFSVDVCSTLDSGGRGKGASDMGFGIGRDGSQHVRVALRSCFAIFVWIFFS